MMMMMMMMMMIMMSSGVINPCFSTSARNRNRNSSRRLHQPILVLSLRCNNNNNNNNKISMISNKSSSSSSSSFYLAKDSSSSKSMASSDGDNNNNNNKWAQKTITLAPHYRGCHLITPIIVKEIGKELSQFNCGLAHFFLQHTSASLTINENYDSDVRHDTETFLNRIVPEGPSAPWKHTLEGPDDMPAHIKSSMFGCSLTIPISEGRLNMGTWQGIWLCEHRDLATPRKVVVTLNGI